MPVSAQLQYGPFPAPAICKNVDNNGAMLSDEMLVDQSHFDSGNEGFGFSISHNINDEAIFYALWGGVTF